MSDPNLNQQPVTTKIKNFFNKLMPEQQQTENNNNNNITNTNNSNNSNNVNSNNDTSTSETVEQLMIGMKFCFQNTKEVNSELTENTKEPQSPFFRTNETYELVNPKTNQSFKITEVSNRAFTYLREKIFNYSKEEFIEEWNLPEEKMKAKEGAGRSGSLFCFSNTKRFIGKTILKAEVIALQQFLPQYLEYMKNSCNNSLIMKLFGLFHYRCGLFSTEEVYFLIFENLLWSKNSNYYLSSPSSSSIDQNVTISDDLENKSNIILINSDNNQENSKLLPIHHIFDLKGRLNKTKRYHGEEVELEETKKSNVRKDKNLDRLFYLGENRDFVINQLKRDVELLSAANLMDYSLLIGIHDVADPNTYIHSPSSKGFYAFGQIYFIGIIDCLTFYGTTKKMAHSIKSLLWTKDQLSTVGSQYYAERFLQYFEDIFPVGLPSSNAIFKPRDATSKSVDLELALNAICSIIREINFSIISNQPYYCEKRSTSGSNSADCKIKFYNPKAFHSIQRLYDIDVDQFSNELTIPLLQLRATYQEEPSSNPFRRRIFVPSLEKRFLIQTISEREMNNLVNIADEYVNYLSKTRNSFLVKIVSAFKVTVSSTKLYIIVTKNPFHSDYLRFSSIYNIHGLNEEDDINREPVKIKCHNRDFPFFANLCAPIQFNFGDQRDEIMKIILNDVTFLQDRNHIEYSLMIAAGNDVDQIGCNPPFGISVLEEDKSRAQICGITSIWKRFGKREKFSSFITSRLNANTYSTQLIKLLEECLIK